MATMNPMKNNRVHRDEIMKIAYNQRHIVMQRKRVESANAWSGHQFFSNFYTADPNFTDFNERELPNRNKIIYMTPTELRRNSRLETQCLDLIAETSKADYEGSEFGWSRIKKRKEMLLPDMKYVLVTDRHSDGMDFDLAGFISFMITYEDGHEVVYIYELHFREQSRGAGWGSMLMEVAEQIGHEIGVDKAMLTVFKSNDRAVKWYKKRGYEVDEYSPEPRKLRDGTVIELKYLILSKRLKEEGENVPTRGRSTIKREVREETAKDAPQGSSDVQSPPPKRARVT